MEHEDPMLILIIGVLVGVAIVTVGFPILKYIQMQFRARALAKHNQRVRDEFYREKFPELKKDIEDLQLKFKSLNAEVIALKADRLPEVLPVKRPNAES